ncbi:MAG TPA: arsenate reductase ArsC [Candidatus Limnocylindrales bacterium]|nr:arsenate reductase ArsC [Candidatus Limnocylindrales bacterium]
MTGTTPVSRPIRVLFVCTGNSARSIMAEALLRKHGGSDFEVFSAGTEPRGINPLTVRTLEEAGLPTKGLSSTSVKEFLGQEFDYVITVCDNARQSCPVFPGSHQGFHWGYDDPAEATGSDDERMAAFRAVFTQLGLRINEFLVIARRVENEAPVTIS